MPPSLTGARVVVVSSEQPGARMAGPAIRALNLAEQLVAAGAVVMVAVPEEPDGTVADHAEGEEGLVLGVHLEGVHRDASGVRLFREGHG